MPRPLASVWRSPKSSKRRGILRSIDAGHASQSAIGLRRRGRDMCDKLRGIETRCRVSGRECRNGNQMK